jgi:tripartite-type tricarboxylate transporter receptor subunit TctC
MRLKATLGLTLIAWAFACEPGGAQTFPSQPIKMVLGFAPGGITDFTGRVIAQGLSRVLGGHPVVPENKPGAGGVIAAAAVAQSKPDGYSMVLIDPGTVVNPMLRTTVPYQMSQLTTIGMVGSSPVVIVTAPSLPVTTLKELIDYGLKNPGKLSYASAGVGSAPHLSAELFMSRTTIQASHIPYAGIAKAYPDIIEGRVPLAFSSIVGALPFTQANQVRALATTGSRRPASYPDIPTVAEAGLPGYDVDIWLAVSVAAGTPPEIIARLNEALNRALKEKEVIDQLAKVGIDATPSTPADANAFIDREEKRWPAVIQAAGLAPK